MHSSEAAASYVWIRFRCGSYGVLVVGLLPTVDADGMVVSRFARLVHSVSSRC
jgi:hypothetical protein